MTVRTKRIYLPAAAEDGHRVLVDRLWPRGMTREAAAIEAWLRELAPSDALRKWFGHEEAKRAEFARRYRAELARPEAAPLLAELVALARAGTVTLLFASKDEERNQAVVLAEVVREGLGET